VLHFRDVLGAATGLKSSKSLMPLNVFSKDNELVIQGLDDSDTGSRLLVYDTQGQLLQQAIVTQAPEMRLPVSLSEGIYILRLQGKRVFTLKFRN
jgi:hypothetical protein